MEQLDGDTLNIMEQYITGKETERLLPVQQYR